MYKFLKELSKIKLGYQFRERIDFDKNGKYKIILMKNVSENNSINFQQLSRTNIEKGVNNSFFIKKYDILFLAKGSQNKAIYIPDDFQNIIATSHFYIIRMKSINKIIPYYLSWYLNQKPVQKYIYRNFYGTVLKHINKQTIENIKIFIPNLSVQKKIIEIMQLKTRENELINKILKLRNRITENILLKVLK